MTMQALCDSANTSVITNDSDCHSKPEDFGNDLFYMASPTKILLNYVDLEKIYEEKLSPSVITLV